MTSPHIAVVAQHLVPGRVARWTAAAYAVPEPYVRAIRRAGGRPLLLPPGGISAGVDAADVLARFDGLVLIGGGDIQPQRYGGPDRPEIYGVEPDRDEDEIELVLAADRASVPTLAICRGAQTVNVAFGGTLHQHLPELDGVVPHGTPGGGSPIVHDVYVAPASRIRRATKAERLACSSHHHQGIDRLGAGLVPTAWSADSLVEGIERERGWLVGVQWHPEDTASSDDAQQALFDEMVDHARR